MSTKKPPDPLDPVLQPPGEGIADSVYEAIGMLLRGLLYHEHSGGRTPEHLAGQVRRSIAILSPAIAAEIEQDGAARVYEERWDAPERSAAIAIAEDVRLGRKEKLEAARNMEGDATIMAVGGARRCASCGRPGGGHEVDCLKVRRMEREKLQAACDHRVEYGTTRTTGDPPGPPCCGRCDLELPTDLQEESP